MFDYDELNERQHLLRIVEVLLTWAFRERATFNHEYMSAGEALSELLEHVGAATCEGSIIALHEPAKNTLDKLSMKPIEDLPNLSDALDVLFDFFSQYGITPRVASLDQRLEFDPEVSCILRDMSLLGSDGFATPDFCLIAINHHFLTPAYGVWNELADEQIWDATQATLKNAPEDYLALMEGRGKYPPKFGEGYLCQHWRYGKWLDQRQQRRAVRTNHPFLPSIINETIIQDNGEVWVPLGYRIG